MTDGDVADDVEVLAQSRSRGRMPPQKQARPDEQFQVPLQPEQVFQRMVRILRDERGWSQQRLADEMGRRGHKWYQSTVAAVERGDRQVGLGEALAIANSFGVPAFRMWTDSGSPEGGEDDARLRREAERLEEELAGVAIRMDLARERRDFAVAKLAQERMQYSVLSNQLRHIWNLIEHTEGQTHLPKP